MRGRGALVDPAYEAEQEFATGLGDGHITDGNEQAPILGFRDTQPYRTLGVAG
jgi:hypothetical protein